MLGVKGKDVMNIKSEIYKFNWECVKTIIIKVLNLRRKHTLSV